jgi:hypothetical protein
MQNPRQTSPLPGDLYSKKIKQYHGRKNGWLRYQGRRKNEN